MSQNTHDDDDARRGAAPDSPYNDADIHPGWADQPQGSYDEADSGGWGAPGHSDTGPIRLTEGSDAGSEQGGSQGAGVGHPEHADAEHADDGTASYGQDSFGQAGYVRGTQEASEPGATAVPLPGEEGGSRGTSQGHDAPSGEPGSHAQAGPHDPNDAHDPHDPQGGWAAGDGPPSYAVPSYGPPPQAPSQYGPPSYTVPSYGPPPQAPSQYGPPSYAVPSYGPPPQAPSQYGQPPQAPSQYGQPAYGPAGGGGYAPGPYSGPGHTRPRSGLAAVFDFTFVSRATRTLAPLLFWLVVTWGVINVVYVIVTLASLPAYGRSGGVVFFGILSALFDVLVKVALARFFLELCVNVSDMAQRRAAGQR